jgi:hypothetical protein
MAHIMDTSESNTNTPSAIVGLDSTAVDDEYDDECQLVSFTNKLPYYVRHISKTTQRNKSKLMTSKSRKY